MPAFEGHKGTIKHPRATLGAKEAGARMCDDLPALQPDLDKAGIWSCHRDSEQPEGRWNAMGGGRAHKVDQPGERWSQDLALKSDPNLGP